jgi:hypothetical protein
MKTILQQIFELLQQFIDEKRQERADDLKAARKEVWLDGGSTKLILRVSDRTLYNYVRQGKLVHAKRGLANYYLESSVMAMLNR